MINKIKRRARKYRMEHQPRYPELFSTLDFTITAIQTLAVISLFGVILLSVAT